jgi:TatD DNase family protein
MGIYISFAGPLTFKNANALLEVAKIVPMDMCLTETDCPYLAPHPLRGTVNGPKNVPIITAKLAELKGVSIEELSEETNGNITRCFDI